MVNWITSIFNWLNNYSAAIQALAITVLVIVTVYYAISTHSMASTMSKEFELSNRPYLSIDKIGQVASGNQLDFKGAIQNRGKVPARLFYIETEVLGKMNTQGYDKEHIIYPGELWTYSILVLKNQERSKAQDIRFKFKYSDLSGSATHCIEYSMRYNGTPGDTLTILSTKLCDP